MTVARNKRLRFKPRSQADDAPASSDLALAADGTITGFARDPAEPERRFTVEILLDGLVVATRHADAFVPRLAEDGRGDGCYGFVLDLPAAALSAAHLLEARLANLGTPVGRPIDLSATDRLLADNRPTAHLRWLGGLRFSGWLDTTAEVGLEASVDGDTVIQFRAGVWTRIEADGEQAERSVRAFDFHLPERFADGRPHRVTLRRDTGESLPAATDFVAFPDGLAATIASFGEAESERLRGELYDRLIPSSLPFADYAAWRERFPLPEVPPGQHRLAVIVIGHEGAGRTLASLEAQSHQEWSAAVIECDPFTIDGDAVEEFLREATDADSVLVAMAGTALSPDALARIGAAFEEHSDAIALYGDLDLLTADGELWPLAFPAFDYERMLEQGYCAHLFALRRRTAEAALRRRPENLYRLFNAVFDETGPHGANVLHLPGALATLHGLDLEVATTELAAATRSHLHARYVASDVVPGAGDMFPAVHVQRIPRRAQITIVIPTRDRLPLLRTCLDSIAPAVERSDAQILVVDNDSSDPDTLSYLSDIAEQGIATLRVEGPFNFARLNNRAAAMLETDILCLLNNDIEATDDRWLEEMLTRLAEPDVGAVGALLTWPSGVVQHGGVVLGMNFMAMHAFRDRLAEDSGYLDLLHVAHECNAVTAACLLTRRADYLSVGGMDETSFAVAFNDVDYCLKLREAGKRIVFTPHARLIHGERVSRGDDARADRRGNFERELDRFRARWRDALVNDPSYNPQLSRDGLPYGALAWPPGDRSARFNQRPRARHLPPGF
ncbi:glycosyltransferase family 2 protein [Bradyrhizobium jicamae]|uniref:glycosyltransferase family 2 protein n=1 Tax=Bradyrhizobium jicamae TaxID=280332 RepID=UPI001BAC0FB8|nr:glycosyltransferase family 2 protein [Bradyrhizobium jicamae]MBR0750736.1 glycosyltransferase family 2 protein [Bradyrhizobium jicamae]